MSPVLARGGAPTGPQRRGFGPDGLRRAWPGELRRRARRSGAKLACLAFLVVVTGGLLRVWLRTQLIHVGYALSRAGNEERRLTEENRALRIEVAMLRRPERISQLASERLGMRAPERAELLAARLRRPTASSPSGPPPQRAIAPSRSTATVAYRGWLAPSAQEGGRRQLPGRRGGQDVGASGRVEGAVVAEPARLFSYLPVGVSGSPRFEGER
jgi:cell division protein FtsL